MIKLHNLPEEFDYNLLLSTLSKYKNPRDKIRSLVKNQEIIRIKKGIYIHGPEYNKMPNIFILANIIYGPSYVTGLSALSFHGMIPERVERLTSSTPNRHKVFKTEIGIFSYQYCPMRTYSIGFTTHKVDKNKQVFIATPEKALADLVVQQKGIKNQNDMRNFIQGIRLPDSLLNKFDKDLLQIIAQSYRRKPVDFLIKTVIKDADLV